MKTSTKKMEKEKVGESETTKPQTDVKQKEERPEENLPPFPKREEDISTGLSMEENQETEGEDFQPLDIEDFCQDMVGAAVEIGCIFMPKLTPLDAKQKKLIGKPLSKVIVKHKLDKACKEEFVLIAAVGFVAYKKIHEMQVVKKDDKKDE